MILHSTLLSKASGALGGTTFSAGKGGLTARAKSAPTDRHSTFQNAIRIQVARFTSRWIDVLTTAQRATWDLYAANVHFSGRLGALRNVGGIGHYIRCNVPRSQLFLPAIIDDAPSIFDLGDFTHNEATRLPAAPNVLRVFFGTTDAWITENGAHMLIYTSRPQNPSVNRLRSGYRFAGEINGSDDPPPGSPRNIATAFPYEMGQRLFWRLLISRADGRLSAPHFGNDVADG